jgi:hypothetical protein
MTEQDSNKFEAILILIDENIERINLQKESWIKTHGDVITWL